MHRFRYCSDQFTEEDVSVDVESPLVGIVYLDGSPYHVWVAPQRALLVEGPDSRICRELLLLLSYLWLNRFPIKDGSKGLIHS